VSGYVRAVAPLKRSARRGVATHSGAGEFGVRDRSLSLSGLGLYLAAGAHERPAADTVSRRWHDEERLRNSPSGGAPIQGVNEGERKRTSTS